MINSCSRESAHARVTLFPDKTDLYANIPTEEEEKKKKTRPLDKAACTQKLLCVPQLFLSCEFIIIITMSRLVRGTHSTGRSNRILRGID